jgi:hypothetical protein
VAVEVSSLVDSTEEDTYMRFSHDSKPEGGLFFEKLSGPSLEQVLLTPSCLITSLRQAELLMRGFEGNPRFTLRCLYRGSRDGFSSRDYYDKMIFLQHFLLVARTKNEGMLFGGFGS